MGVNVLINPCMIYHEINNLFKYIFFFRMYFSFVGLGKAFYHLRIGVLPLFLCRNEYLPTLTIRIFTTI